MPYEFLIEFLAGVAVTGIFTMGSIVVHYLRSINTQVGDMTTRITELRNEDKALMTKVETIEKQMQDKVETVEGQTADSLKAVHKRITEVQGYLTTHEQKPVGQAHDCSNLKKCQ